MELTNYKTGVETGKVSMCWMEPTPRLIIKDLGIMKQVLMNKEGHFQKPYLNPLILFLTQGLTTLEGEKWATQENCQSSFAHGEVKGLSLLERN